MVKPMIQDGMWVKLNNGEYYMIYGGSLLKKDGYICIDKYHEDLTHRQDRTYDIVEILSMNPYRLAPHLTIWEREDKKEMTVVEIEKALGYSIKIVK